MTFLAPFWMLLAGAAAIPLLLHLLRRHSGVRAEFPAARYLARAEREHSRSLRLRNLLLMMFRVLVLLLLAFAAARPASRWGWGGGTAPVALAIVVDNSLSTSVVEGGRPVFAALIDSARHILDGTSSSDRVWIVGADGRVAGGVSTSARTALESLRPLGGAADLPAAVRLAATTASGATGHAPRVVVLTDGQRAAWSRRVAVPDGVEYIFVTPRTTAPLNRGITDATPSPALWTPRGSLLVRVHADDTVAFRVMLVVGAVPRTIARGVVHPGAAQAVRVAPADTGWIAGRVEIDSDEMPGDDTRYFATWIGAPPRVQVSSAAGPFAGSAVEVLKGDGRVRDGRDVSLVPAQEVDGLGRVFITAPALPSQLGAANQALARRGIPWRLGAARRGGRLRGSGLEGADVQRRFALVATAGEAVDTLATVDGEPWAVAGDSPGGRYVLVGSALLPDATNLPVRAEFVPWLATTLVDRLATGVGGVVQATPGAAVPMPAWADSVVLQADTTRRLGDAEFTAPTEPGVHFFSRNGRRVGALVVNAEESESVLARMDDGEVVRLLGDRTVRIADGAAWRDVLVTGKGARSLMVPALIAVLALMGLEGATTRRARGAA